MGFHDRSCLPGGKNESPPGMVKCIQQGFHPPEHTRRRRYRDRQRPETGRSHRRYLPEASLEQRNIRTRNLEVEESAGIRDEKSFKKEKVYHFHSTTSLFICSMVRHPVFKQKGSFLVWCSRILDDQKPYQSTLFKFDAARIYLYRQARIPTLGENITACFTSVL